MDQGLSPFALVEGGKDKLPTSNMMELGPLVLQQLNTQLEVSHGALESIEIGLQ